MSSFSNPHYMYLFALKNGKKKLAYGQSPEDALDILRIRLTEIEMSEVVTDQYMKISQRELQQHVSELGLWVFRQKPFRSYPLCAKALLSKRIARLMAPRSTRFTLYRPRRSQYQKLRYVRWKSAAGCAAI